MCASTQPFTQLLYIPDIDELVVDVGDYSEDSKTPGAFDDISNMCMALRFTSRQALLRGSLRISERAADIPEEVSSESEASIVLNSQLDAMRPRRVRTSGRSSLGSPSLTSTRRSESLGGWMYTDKAPEYRWPAVPPAPTPTTLQSVHVILRYSMLIEDRAKPKFGKHAEAYRRVQLVRKWLLYNASFAAAPEARIEFRIAAGR